MFEVISLEDKGRWNEIIRSMKNYDFYFLAEYHQMDKSGLPLLFYYKDDSSAFALPVIVREIEETPYKDITSIYGYAGPLTSNDNPSQESIANFQKELLYFFNSHSIVSVFSRLHPLFPNQEKLLNGLGEIVDTNLTVTIDLTQSEKEQRRQYSSSTRHQINSLNRKGILVREIENNEEIKAFIHIYRENMERVNADEMYFFSQDYFFSFLEIINSHLYIAIHNDEIISGSLFTTCNGIIQSHLSATKNTSLKLSPIKLVWDNIRIFGLSNQMKHFHLGGGYRGDNSSLFKFKTQFSKQYFMFKTWKYIHNKEIYNRLVNKRNKENISNTSFFPRYRLD